jgi:uncharacterized protein (TIGR03437 family)
MFAQPASDRGSDQDRIRFFNPVLANHNTVHANYQVVINGQPSNTLDVLVTDQMPLFLVNDNNAAGIHFTKPRGSQTAWSILTNQTPRYTDDTSSIYPNGIAAWLIGLPEDQDLRALNITDTTPTNKLYYETAPTITFNGQPVQVDFYGHAPGIITKGIGQVNLRIPAGTAAGANDLTITNGTYTHTAGLPTMNGTTPYLYGTVKAGLTSVDATDEAAKQARKNIQTKFPVTLDGRPLTTDSNGNYVIPQVDANGQHTLTATTNGRYANYTRTGTLEELIKYFKVSLPEIVVDAEAPTNPTDPSTGTFFTYNENAPLDKPECQQYLMTNTGNFIPCIKWEAGSQPINNIIAGRYQMSQFFFDSPAPRFTDDRWNLPVKVDPNLDQAPTGLAYFGGVQIPAREAIINTLKSIRVNGIPAVTIVDSLGPNESGIELSYGSTTGAGYGITQQDENQKHVRGVADMVSDDSSIASTLAHELGIHGLGGENHTSSKLYLSHFRMSLDWQQYAGGLTSLDRAAQDFAYSQPMNTTRTPVGDFFPGLDPRRFSLPANYLQEALTIFTGGAIGYPAGATIRSETQPSNTTAYTAHASNEIGTAAFLPLQPNTMTPPPASTPTLQRRESADYTPPPRGRQSPRMAVMER